MCNLEMLSIQFRLCHKNMHAQHSITQHNTITDKTTNTKKCTLKKCIFVLCLFQSINSNRPNKIIVVTL